MRAIQACIIAPIWDQFSDLLPAPRDDHPLGCHRPRIPDRVVFDKLVQVLVFGCAYWRIADDTCSATTLRRRRDAWIDAEIMGRLQALVLDAYDRMIGMELTDVAVDGCITKAPCGGEVAGRSPVDRGKQGLKRSTLVDAAGIPLGTVTAPANPHDSPLLEPTLDTLDGLGPLPDAMTVHLDGGYDSGVTRAALGPWLGRGDRREGQTGTAYGHKAVGGRAHHRLDQRPQEATVVYGASGARHRFLAGVRRSDRDWRTAHPGGVDPLSMGHAALPQTVRCSLLAEALSAPYTPA